MREAELQGTARRMMVGAGIAGVVVIAAAGFLIWQVFGGCEPAPVALSSLAPSSAATASGGGSFAGYGIDPPVGFLVLSIQDHGTIETHLLLQKS